jgi:hypothetical protein
MAEFENIEFFRCGYGMLPDMRDRDPGMPICFPRSAGGSIFTGKCDCRENRSGRSCPHLEQLVRAAGQIQKQNGGRSWGESFATSLWYRLAAILSEGDAILPPDIRVAHDPQKTTWCFLSPRDSLKARLFDDSEISVRFLERAGKAPGSNRFRNRAGLIHKLATTLYSDDERRMNQAGVLTCRQTAEQSFWGILAYHSYREYGARCTFHP